MGLLYLLPQRDKLYMWTLHSRNPANIRNGLLNTALLSPHQQLVFHFLNAQRWTCNGIKKGTLIQYADLFHFTYSLTTINFLLKFWSSFRFQPFILRYVASTFIQHTIMHQQFGPRFTRRSCCCVFTAVRPEAMKTQSCNQPDRRSLNTKDVSIFPLKSLYISDIL